MDSLTTESQQYDHTHTHTHRTARLLLLLDKSLTPSSKKSCPPSRTSPPTRDAMFKTFHAIAVLQARRVLARLLTKWPSTGTRLSSVVYLVITLILYLCMWCNWLLCFVVILCSCSVCTYTSVSSCFVSLPCTCD